MINASLGLPVIQKVVTDIIHDTISDIGFGDLDQWLDDYYSDAIEGAQEHKDRIKELLGERVEAGGRHGRGGGVAGYRQLHRLHHR